MGSMATEREKVVDLVGSPQNPARDPKVRNGKGTIGDTAFKDSVTIVIAAWVVLLFIVFSLRNYTA